MDWDSFMAGLSDRDKAIIHCMVEGEPLASLARSRGFSASTLMYREERLAKAIAEFMGVDIIIEIGRKPRWRDSINCSRERLAFREERRHL
jgi:hypothetical protein